MFGLLFSQIYHLMGFLAGLKGFTAAVVGGIGSIPGAMLGGLLVGLVESWAKGYLNGNMSDLVVFGILIGVMLHAPERPAGHAGAPEGVDDDRARDRRAPGTPPEGGAPIGVDKWVAQADERRERAAGPARADRRTSGGCCRRPGKLALLTPAIVVPFLPISQGNLFNYGIFILIYALLALGLNVVVGFAGLLDLGYVAFFGFGAYIYAFLSGTHSEKGHVYTHHWDAQYSIPVCVAICALLGLFLGSSSRRLLGDYLAIVTLFFGQAFVVFTNADRPVRDHERLERPRQRRPAEVLRRPHHDRHDPRLLLVPARRRRRRCWSCSTSSASRGPAARGRRSREDPLAAELMGMPVNRLKIMAFSFGAGIAGLAGSIFAAVQTGAFPQNFGTAVLILIYAVVILGGTGSLTGMVVGAIVIIASNQVLDSTSPPNLARVLFYVGPDRGGAC